MLNAIWRVGSLKAEGDFQLHHLVRKHCLKLDITEGGRYVGAPPIQVDWKMAPAEGNSSLRRIFWTAFAKTKMDRNQRSPLPIPPNNLLKTCKTDKLGVKSFLPHYLPTVDPNTGSTSKLVMRAERVPKDEAILYQWLVQVSTKLMMLHLG